MQRTVKGFKAVYGRVELNSNGMTIVDTEEKILNRAKSEKQARKQAEKFRPHGKVLVMVQEVENLYFLEDEIFFKYAVIIQPEE